MLSHDRYVYLVIGDSYLIVEHALHGDVTDGAGWRRCSRRRLAAARPLLSLDDLGRPLAKERLQLFYVLCSVAWGIGLGVGADRFGFHHLCFRRGDGAGQCGAGTWGSDRAVGQFFGAE